MSMYFGDWLGLVRTVAVGVPVYFGIILLLRITGKRALAKINAYGLVVTVALGSTLATTLMSKDVQLAEGLLAVGLLLGLQFIIAALVLRFPLFRRLVTQRPSLLLYRGELLEDELKSERVTREELEAAVRSSGHMSFTAIHAVVLETDGNFSVIVKDEGDPDAMQNILNYPPRY